jgi:hypothetical protein
MSGADFPRRAIFSAVLHAMSADAPVKKRRRRWLRAVFVLLFVSALVSALCVWYAVTQPIANENTRWTAPLVTPDRLMAHVTALSEWFAPLEYLVRQCDRSWSWNGYTDRIFV